MLHIFQISPENIPEELKSLHVVLEMKTEELKSLRTKNMDLQRKVCYWLRNCLTSKK